MKLKTYETILIIGYTYVPFKKYENMHRNDK